MYINWLGLHNGDTLQFFHFFFICLKNIVDSVYHLLFGYQLCNSYRINAWFFTLTYQFRKEWIALDSDLEIISYIIGLRKLLATK